MLAFGWLIRELWGAVLKWSFAGQDSSSSLSSGLSELWGNGNLGILSSSIESLFFYLDVAS